MSTSIAFNFVAERLGEWTDLDSLSARGTIRILLKDAGLEVASVSVPEMTTVAKQLLPKALRARGVADGDAVAKRIADALSTVQDDASAGETPDAVFARLGR